MLAAYRLLADPYVTGLYYVDMDAYVRPDALFSSVPSLFRKAHYDDAVDVLFENARDQSLFWHLHGDTFYLRDVALSRISSRRAGGVRLPSVPSPLASMASGVVRYANGGAQTPESLRHRADAVTDTQHRSGSSGGAAETGTTWHAVLGMAGAAGCAKTTARSTATSRTRRPCTSTRTTGRR